MQWDKNDISIHAIASDPGSDRDRRPRWDRRRDAHEDDPQDSFDVAIDFTDSVELNEADSESEDETALLLHFPAVRFSTFDLASELACWVEGTLRPHYSGRTLRLTRFRRVRRALSLRQLRRLVGTPLGLPVTHCECVAGLAEVPDED